MQALEKFKAELTATERNVLSLCLQSAQQPLPENSIAWHLGNAIEATGSLAPAHAKILQSLSSDWLNVPVGLSWDTPEKTPLSRTLALELLATRLRDEGHITGWRNEKFSLWSEATHLNGEAIPPEPSRPEAFRMERAAFRFLGLHSHAVHINGFTSNGDMWCGRRAISKSVDPGMLDNLAAGGLPAGETLFDCGVREMAEEAGLPASLAQTALPCGYVETCRSVREGWHHETLWVYNIVLPNEWTPSNQDGEVSEFVLLSPSQVVTAIQQNAFTVDAGCVIAHAVLNA